MHSTSPTVGALCHNLVEAVEKVVRQQHVDVREPAPVAPAAALPEYRDPVIELLATESAATESAAPGTDALSAHTTEDEPAGSARPTRLAARTRDRYAAIHRSWPPAPISGRSARPWAWTARPWEASLAPARSLSC